MPSRSDVDLGYAGAVTKNPRTGASDTSGYGPRVLVGERGWRITRADFTGGDRSGGRVTFSRGDQVLDVHWRPKHTYDGYFDSRARISPPSGVTLLGQSSTMWSYDATDFTTIRPVTGVTFLEVRGGVGDRQEYLRVLDKLRLVDEQTWLAAMPANVVVPARQAEAVEEMLRGIPTPPEFDHAPVTFAWPAERYHLGVHVIGPLACAWIDHWRTGRGEGDREKEQRALAAMASSRHWPILQEMDQDGDWSSAVWEAADAMAAGNPEPETIMGFYGG